MNHLSAKNNSHGDSMGAFGIGGTRLVSQGRYLNSLTILLKMLNGTGVISRELNENIYFGNII